MQAVYLLDIKDIGKNYGRIVKVLPLSAIKKAEEYKEQNDRLRSVGGALLIETFTAESPIFYNEYGKPYKKEPPFFNLSHSGDKVGIFVSDGDSVGFDIQYIKEYNEKLTDYVFGEEEKAGVKDGAGFAARWALKEAAAKCVGVGLRNLKTQTLKDITADTFTFVNDKLYYKTYIYGEYALALCSYQALHAEILRIDCDFVLKTLAKRV